MTIWTVSKLNFEIKSLIEQSFNAFYIEGEISNLTIHRSGHLYFSLKDENSQIQAVFFHGKSLCEKLALTDGIQVEIKAKLSVYHVRGSYQLLVENIRLKGKGLLEERYQLLKEKLTKEGLFDQEKKKNIPFLPKTIGVITSPTSAAIIDFLTVINRRFATINIKIFPVMVQGEYASNQICKAIFYANEVNNCDVLVLTRGGGSLEDLWSFNEEETVRAVFTSKIPIISAVGHERDVTLCDFAADKRAATPSEAAEIVIAEKQAFYDQLSQYLYRLEQAFTTSWNRQKQNIQVLTEVTKQYEPSKILSKKQENLMFLTLRYEQYMERKLDKCSMQLNSFAKQLSLLNPTNTLKRGYVFVEQGNEIKEKSTDIDINEDIVLVFQDNKMKVRYKNE